LELNVLVTEATFNYTANMGSEGQLVYVVTGASRGLGLEFVKQASLEFQNTHNLLSSAAIMLCAAVKFAAHSRLLQQ
jgi:hypothetical protein